MRIRTITVTTTRIIEIVGVNSVYNLGNMVGMAHFVGFIVLLGLYFDRRAKKRRKKGQDE